MNTQETAGIGVNDSEKREDVVQPIGDRREQWTIQKGEYQRLQESLRKAVEQVVSTIPENLSELPHYQWLWVVLRGNNLVRDSFPLGLTLHPEKVYPARLVYMVTSALALLNLKRDGTLYPGIFHQRYKILTHLGALMDLYPKRLMSYGAPIDGTDYVLWAGSKADPQQIEFQFPYCRTIPNADLLKNFRYSLTGELVDMKKCGISAQGLLSFATFRELNFLMRHAGVRGNWARTVADRALMVFLDECRQQDDRAANEKLGDWVKRFDSTYSWIEEQFERVLKSYGENNLVDTLARTPMIIVIDTERLFREMNWGYPIFYSTRHPEQVIPIPMLYQRHIEGICFPNSPGENVLNLTRELDLDRVLPASIPFLKSSPFGQSTKSSGLERLYEMTQDPQILQHLKCRELVGEKTFPVCELRYEQLLEGKGKRSGLSVQEVQRMAMETMGGCMKGERFAPVDNWKLFFDPDMDLCYTLGDFYDQRGVRAYLIEKFSFIF